MHQAIERQASVVCGKPVMLTSPLQLRQIIFDELKLDKGGMVMFKRQDYELVSFILLYQSHA